MYNNYSIKLTQGYTLESKTMVQTLHYSKSTSICSLVYCLYIDDKLMGIAGFGTPVGRKCQETYSTTGRLVIELKRFVLDPRALKNTGSWFIAKCIKSLKEKQYDSVLSYADPKFGHTGILYRASNFKYLGVQKYHTEYVKYKRMNYQIREVYTKGRTGIKLREALRLGKAKRYKVPKKHIFLYKL